MELSPAAQIKILLPQVTTTELVEIITLATMRRNHQAMLERRTPEQLFYGCISDILNAKTGAEIQFLASFAAKQSQHYRLMTKNLDALDFWIDKHFRGVSLAKRGRIYRIVIDLICENLEAVPLALNPRIIIANMPKAPMLIDRAFPGYIQNNLLPMLLETKYSSFDD